MPNARREDLPGTLERSPAKAQRTYTETLDAAHDTYDSEERAHRTAYAALKHSYEKVEPAKDLGIRGRSAMTKLELAQAIARKQD